jgi:hypothetical protein
LQGAAIEQRVGYVGAESLGDRLAGDVEHRQPPGPSGRRTRRARPCPRRGATTRCARPSGRDFPAPTARLGTAASHERRTERRGGVGGNCGTPLRMGEHRDSIWLGTMSAADPRPARRPGEPDRVVDVEPPPRELDQDGGRPSQPKPRRERRARPRSGTPPAPGGDRAPSARQLAASPRMLPRSAARAPASRETSPTARACAASRTAHASPRGRRRGRARAPLDRHRTGLASGRARRRCGRSRTAPSTRLPDIDALHHPRTGAAGVEFEQREGVKGPEATNVAPVVAPSRRCVTWAVAASAATAQGCISTGAP